MERPFRILIASSVLLVCLAAFAPALRFPYEICDNALDDDQDGLIDLRDPDCACGKAPPLIPNGSFEESDCCPDAPSQDFCIRFWQKSTLSTPDYLNDCGWFGWDQFPVPLPLPDGHSCMGFRNGRFEGRTRPEEKEFIGICLEDNPLQAETTYRFHFFIGFTDEGHSPATDLVFYGTPDCDYLPAGIDRPDMVCPGDEPGWFKMESIPIRGTNIWVEYEFEYTPSETIAALAIGPECDFAFSTLDLYYFFDDLVVEKKPPVPPVIAEAGRPCSPGFALQVARDDKLQYQWYRNQIALVGETAHRLELNGREGNYQAAIYLDGDCLLTPPYTFLLTAPVTKVYETFCAGDSYLFNGRLLTEPGVYRETLQSANGCDSVVQLTLDLQYPETDTLNVRIFAGESFRLGARSINQPGSYQAQLPRQQGCDSLVLLNLEFFDVFFPNVFSPDGDRINDRFTVFGGPELTRIVSLSIFDRWGALIWTGRDLPPGDESAGWDGKRNGQPLPAGVYVYSASLELEDGSQRNRAGSVVILR